MFKRYCQLFLLAGSLALIAATTASASNRPAAFTLTPQVGMMVFEGNQDLDPGLTGGLALGYNFGAHWGAEGVLTFTRAGQAVGGGDDIDVTAAHLDLLYHLRPQKRLVPYLSLGGGGLEFKANSEKDNDLLAGYGVGLKYFFFDDVALRIDLKHLFDINFHDTQKEHGHYNMLAATAGVLFQFGGEKKVVLVSDSDVDGVVDAVDRCPATPAGVTVDAAGCPVQPSDRDQDGIADNLDLCPDTAAGVVVNEKGCPIVTDKDRDGVSDTQDVCPDTPARTVVDARGCPAQVTLVTPLPEPALTFHLEYLPNESEVRNDFAAEMQKMADFVKANPGRRFVIEGHTDSVGSDASNMRLSLLRAEKIKAYLIEKMKIPASLLEARGFGESNPVADNNTQEGRQQNRRVVIIAFPQL